MTDIWKHNPWYSIGRIYVDCCTRHSFSRMQLHGLENLPEDGAFILAPNHCGALMDAVVVLLTRRAPIVFGARADIFENKIVASILKFLRILPMVRKRDGIRKVLRNYETIQSATEVLCNDVPFCMFSEGTHRAKHSLLPITKGIFRVASSAAEQIKGKKVYVVPIGIEYGDYFHYRSTVLLSIGRPLDFTEFLAEDRSEADQFLAFRDDLGRRIAEQITWLPDDEDYDTRWAKVEAASRKLKGSLRDKMLARKAIADKVVAGENVEEIESGCKWWKWPLAVLTFPFFILAAILSAPMWITAEILCTRKIKDRAFHNTARYGCKLLGTILMTIIWAIVLFCNLHWLAATAILMYFFHSFSIFYDYLRLLRG